MSELVSEKVVDWELELVRELVCELVPDEVDWELEPVSELVWEKEVEFKLDTAEVVVAVVSEAIELEAEDEEEDEEEDAEELEPEPEPELVEADV